MLNLTRRKNESFVIEVGDEIITVSVSDITATTAKKQVQLGIDAPAHIKIWRTEIYDAIQENKMAAEASQLSPSYLQSLFKKP